MILVRDKLRNITMNSPPILLHILDVLFNMIWQIYWPLAFGLILSSFIRGQLPIETVIKHLGRTNLKSISFSTLLGMLSSSCSYAAASISHTLLVKKATLANAMAFLVSSTNLIVEMFIVLIALLGWTFLWGEILGGLLLITFIAFLFHFFYPKKLEIALRKKIEEESTPLSSISDSGMDMKTMESEKDSIPSSEEQKTLKKHNKLTQAASLFNMDLSMIGKEILIGVVVSSILIAIVPLQGWHALFISPDVGLPPLIHSFLDVLIGIGVAVIAYVCSVGNLLLAAALWHGGISFGGVIGFILADVLTIPMMRVYSKYYGARPARWMVLLLFIAILATGLCIDAIFMGFDVHVSSETLRPLIQEGFGLNLTTLLNLFFIPFSIWFYFVGKKANVGMRM